MIFVGIWVKDHARYCFTWSGGASGVSVEIISQRENTNYNLNIQEPSSYNPPKHLRKAVLHRFNYHYYSMRILIYHLFP